MRSSLPSAIVAAAASGLAIASTVHGAPSQSVPGGASSVPVSLTNVHLLAVETEIFGPVGFDAWRVNNASSGLIKNVDLDAANAIEGAAGLYALAAINASGGVSLMLRPGSVIEGITTWSDLFQTDQNTVKGWLLAGDLNDLEDWFAAEIYDAGLASPLGRRAPFVAFAPEPVVVRGDDRTIPAPSILAVTGLTGLAALRRRR